MSWIRTPGQNLQHYLPKWMYWYNNICGNTFLLTASMYCPYLSLLSMQFIKKNKKHHHDKRHGSTTCFRRQPPSRILWVKCNFADTTIEETILPLQLRLLSSAAKVTDCSTARFWNWAKMCLMTIPFICHRHHRRCMCKKNCLV